MNTLSQFFKTAIPAWAALIIFIYLSFTGSAAAAETRQTNDWQTQRLMHPTKHQLEKESHGQIFIYDGISPQLIERAMDQAFDRIESMMFVNTKHTKHGNNTEHSSTQNTATGSDATDDTDDDDGCE